MMRITLTMLCPTNAAMASMMMIGGKVRKTSVTRISTLLTVLAAVTVVIGMRTVGLLLVSAIMIVPVAASQQLVRSFRGSAIGGVIVGLAAALLGLIGSFELDVPPGPMIVFVALGAFLLAALAGPVVRRRTG